MVYVCAARFRLHSLNWAGPDSATSRVEDGEETAADRATAARAGPCPSLPPHVQGAVPCLRLVKKTVPSAGLEIQGALWWRKDSGGKRSDSSADMCSIAVLFFSASLNGVDHCI